MSEIPDRARILRATKKCLSDAYDQIQNAMDALDEIGKGSLGSGMTSLVGGFAMKNPKEYYREALIDIDSAEKALKPLFKRYHNGMVNETHFKDEKSKVLMTDLIQFDFAGIVTTLTERTRRESVWYRLREMSQKVEEIFKLVCDT
ncbi:MAG: hypothetical protein ACTSUB_09045 [Candidatus Thorarchaeota archaeon]